MGYGSKSIQDWVDDIYQLARSKGWWSGTDGRELTADEVLSKLMLVITELAEAAERVRAADFLPKEYWRDGDKPDGFGVEIADAVIRLFDLCGRLDIPLEQNIRDKHFYNATRPFRHGKRA